MSITPTRPFTHAAALAVCAWVAWHEWFRLSAQAHRHENLVAMFAPHHWLPVVVPAVLVASLFVAAYRGRVRSTARPMCQVSASIGAVTITAGESAEFANGALGHGFAGACALALSVIAVLLLTGWLIGRAVDVVIALTRRTTPRQRRRSTPTLRRAQPRVFVTCVFVALYGRRGPPAFSH